MITMLQLNNKIINVKLEVPNIEIENSYLYSIKEKKQTFQFTQDELKNELWKPIKDLSIEYKNNLSISGRWLKLYDVKNYCISTLGRISYYDEENNKLILRGCMEDKDGYKDFSLFHSPYSIHRIVAFVFKFEENIDLNEYSVDHINFIKNDNRVENLRWISKHENNGRKQKKNKVVTQCYKIDEKKIKCVNLDTNEEKYFPTLISVAQYFNINKIKISNCYKGKIDYILINNQKYQFICNKMYTSYKWWPIIQLDIKTHQIVNIFITRNEIKEKYPNFDLNNIKTVCDKNKKNNTFTFISKGYIWLYLDHYNDNFKNESWYDYIDLSHYKFVQLSSGFKIVKMYNNIFDVINDGFNIDNVIKLCENKDKKCISFNYNCNRIKRNWLYLDDYLQMSNKNDIDDINENDYTNIACSPKIGAKIIEKPIINPDNKPKILPSLILTNQLIKYNKNEDYGYSRDFTQNELNEEEWCSLKLLDEKYKKYITDDGMWSKLYCDNQYYISNLGRVARYDLKKQQLILKHVFNDKDGYKLVWLNTNCYSVHRLVAFLFIDNPRPDINWHINHINNIKNDNKKENLEWCNIDYNNKYKNKGKNKNNNEIIK